MELEAMCMKGPQMVFNTSGKPLSPFPVFLNLRNQGSTMGFIKAQGPPAGNKVTGPFALI